MHRLAAGFFAALCVFTLPNLVLASTTTDERAALQAQLDQIEKDIATNQGSLSVLQTQRTSLERDIAILDNKIQNAQLQIKQSDLALKQLGNSIADKEASIQQVDVKVADSQESLASLIRRTREIDDISIAQIALSGTYDDIFTDIDNFQTLQKALDASFTQMAALRSDLAARKKDLEDAQDSAQQVRNAQVIAKQQVQSDESQKQNILKVTKGQEKAYQQLIADKQKQAAAIREALFGLRDTSAVSFGDMYSYAKEASAKTGVRPAFILAILEQESDLGQNVGSCYVSNLLTGAGVSKTSGRAIANVMKAPRDTEPFQTITDAVGRDWSNSPVSCPQSFGYGGAMGPAQFIPSTWMLYQTRLANATGQTTPDPWDPRTATFATALYMMDLGADAGTSGAERTAACRYFSGRSCSGSIAIYGDSVLDHEADIQSQIDILNGAGS